MGSIIIFAAIILIRILLVCFCAKCPCSCAKKICSPKVVWVSALTFIHGTFFEIAVCVSVSMRMFEYKDYLEQSDKVSMAAQIFFIVVLVAYLSFILYFATFKSG